MKIYLGADHAGFELKEQMKTYLKDLGHSVEDQGAFVLEEGDDYPDFISIVAKMVAADPNSKGLIFGASGQGEAMSANRFNRVRAAVYYGGSDEIITLSRQHNNANVLSLGAKFVDEATAKRIIDLWLSTGFSGDDRHIRRIVKLDNEGVGQREALEELAVDLQ